MKIFKDHKGAAFDVPVDKVKLFDEYIENQKNNSMKISKAIELPELEEDPDYGRSGYGGNRGSSAPSR
jgi:hypothetical protein